MAGSDAATMEVTGAGAAGRPRGHAIGLAVMVAAIAAAPFFLYPVFVMKVLCFGIFAAAFNLLLGFVGLLSFGHAAFFGMGSYVAAYAAKAWGWDFALSVLAGGVVAGLIGVAFGWLAIRRQGIYFAMITLALAQMVFFFCLEAPFTGGEDGIQQVPRAPLLGLLPTRDDMTVYWLIATVFLACFLLIQRIVHSPFGRILTAIRENEPRALSLGYRVDQYKLAAFVMSASLAGIAGAAKSQVFGIATLTDVDWSMSGEVVLMTLLGGIGTVFGPVVGALVFGALETYLAQMGDWVTVTQGAIFIACVLAFRRGIVGELTALLRRR